MTPERWREVEAVYQSAMDREPASRGAYLAEACKDDEGLRSEVESLLRLNTSPVLIDQPAWQAAGELLDNDSIVATGTQLGPYRIEGVLGAGGMGQVYRALDTRLDRLVALKVSKEEFGDRFQREARAVAALNHPNICTLYDVGPNYLVMELVEGPTLAERIKEGPIPLEEALGIARQIADALEAAHERGIVHRDLKPGNIKIKPDGAVKVLDFGLAKRRVVEAASDVKPEDSPTMSMALTSAGVILGTAAYMSPEQARGQEVDKRADIWAFGVVLYEMLTGQQLFEGATVTDTLAAVLTKEPDWNAVPIRSCRLLQACLERDPKRRLRDIGDCWRFLEDGSVSPPARRRGLILALAAVFALFAAVVLWAWWRERPSEKSLVHLEVNLGQGVALQSPSGADAILSPDGTRLAFVSGGRIFTRLLKQPNAAELAGTDGAYAPFFSPDGEWIAFFAESKLKKVPAGGGAVNILSDTFARASGFARGGAWGEDGNIVAALGEQTPLIRISSAGGVPSAISEFDGARRQRTHRWPQILPGGKAVLFTAHTSSGVGFDGATLEVVVQGDPRPKLILAGGTFGRYLPTGHLVYIRRGTLYAVPFDLDRLQVRGSPAPVLEHAGYSVQNGSAQIDFSRTGTLMYRSGGASGLLTLQWLDASGRIQPLWNKPGEYVMPRLSPDGRRVAVSVEEGANADIWVYDWERDSSLRITFGGGVYIQPLWSPDGRYVIFADRADGNRILWVRADGTGKPEPLTEKGVRPIPWAFTHDGKHLAFSDVAPDFREDARRANHDLWTVPVESDVHGLRAGKPEPLLQTPFTEMAAAFSPDGRWMAFESNQSGSSEVYVMDFPEKHNKSKISNNGGRFPYWSPKTHELFFRSADGLIMIAPYTVKGDLFIAGKPRIWSEKRLPVNGFGGRDFDLAPDGKRIVALMPSEASEEMIPGHVFFVENFFAELLRRVPTGR